MIGTGISIGQVAARRRPAAVAAAVAGLTPSAPTIAPSIQYHPNTSALTMRADSTFTGYIAPFLSTNPNYAYVSELVVTAWSGATSQVIKNGMTLVTGGAAAGTQVVSSDGTPGGNNGAGGTGRYFVTGGPQTVGSAGSPVTFTAAAMQVVGMSDLKGIAPLSSADNKGPELRTDGNGVKFLRFAGESAAYEWLRNLTVTGIDTHNIAWFMVAGVHNAGKVLSTVSPTFVSLGANEVGGVPAQTTVLGTAATNGGFPYSAAIAWGGVPPNTPTAIAKRLIIGSQLQVIGVSNATTDGVGGTATTLTGRVWINETSYTPTGSNAARGTNVTGLTINARALAAGPNNGGSFDLYELNGYILGELGAPTTSQARGDAIVASIMSNWAIPPIARSLTLLGDSRTEYGSTSTVSGGGNEATGVTIASLLAQRGPNGLPADVRVVSWAAGGQGVPFMNAYLDRPYNSGNVPPTTLETSYMLGGGKDFFTIFSGTNEGAVWPSTDSNTLGGRYSYATNQFIDDYYNGPGYTVTLTANVPANSNALTATAVTPAYIPNGMVFTGTGWAPGTASGSNYAGSSSTVTLLSQQPTALVNVATTGFLGSYQYVVGKLLSRGFKGVWFPEISHILPYFNSKVLANGVNDALAGAGQTYAGKLAVADLSQITIGGKFVFGADFNGYGLYQLDYVHMTTQGKVAMVFGGDTPQYGMSANIKTLLAS